MQGDSIAKLLHDSEVVQMLCYFAETCYGCTTAKAEDSPYCARTLPGAALHGGASLLMMMSTALLTSRTRWCSTDDNIYEIMQWIDHINAILKPCTWSPRPLWQRAIAQQ